MSYPAVGTLTERLWGRLPAMYRTADEADGDYPLLRFLSLTCDQADDVETLLDRFQAGDLVNPDTADSAWLYWLAQEVGAVVTRATLDPDKRHVIALASSGWQAGTEEAITEAAQTALTGTRYIEFARVSAFVVAIVTKATETPGGSASVLAAIENLRARPAGVSVVWGYFTAPWSTWEAVYPTWAAIEGAGSWQAIEST